MEKAARTNNDIVFMRLDRELNQLIVDAARNDYAARAMKFLQGLSRRFWYMHYRMTADLPLCARLHAKHALAILVEHLGDNQRAIKLVEPFMKNVVANLDNDWRLTGGEIDEALAALK